MANRENPILLSNSEINQLGKDQRQHFIRGGLRAMTGAGVVLSSQFFRLFDPQELNSFFSSIPMTDNPSAVAVLSVIGYAFGSILGGLAIAKSAGSEFEKVHKIEAVLDGAVALHEAVALKHSPFLEKDSELLARSICMLPPIGAKIALPESGAEGFIKLPPYLLAEQLVPNLMKKSLETQTKSDYLVQQLTIQGRAGDGFKLVPILMLMHSDNTYDWNQPSFQTPWGKDLAPMIHDGGKVKYGFNPLWTDRTGRTDFLSRVVFADQLEQDEEKLMIEAKALQRLKLTYDCAKGSTMPHINYQNDQEVDKIRALNQVWQTFRFKSQAFLRKCGLSELLDDKWILNQPRDVPGMAGFNPRWESDMDTIRPGLLKLNAVMETFPRETQSTARRLLVDSTARVDQILDI